MQIQAIGFPWYKRENFARLRALFEDGHKLHRTYDEWFAAAEGACKAQEIKGVRVVRADIDPDDFPKWAEAQGMKLDANARSRYASFIAYKTLTSVQPPDAVQ